MLLARLWRAAAWAVVWAQGARPPGTPTPRGLRPRDPPDAVGCVRGALASAPGLVASAPGPVASAPGSGCVRFGVAFAPGPVGRLLLQERGNPSALFADGFP